MDAWQSSILDWLREEQRLQIPPSWVPGASDTERYALARLGGLVDAILPRPLALSLPATVQSWLTSSWSGALTDSEGSARATPPVGIVGATLDAFRANADAALSDIYADLVSPANRRNLGTFFTPVIEVHRMLDMWDFVASNPQVVVDVGAGVGVFTTAASDRWRNSRVAAVDVNPVTLGLLAARILVAGGSTARRYAQSVDLIHDDFTRFVGSAEFPSSPGRLILGNPPFTRAALLDGQDRRRLSDLTEGMCGTRASLSTAIAALSLLSLGEEDGLCLLLPAQWLEADYAAGLREKIAALRAHRHVELKLIESQLFENAIVDAVVLLVGPVGLSRGFFISNWKDDKPRQLQSPEKLLGRPSWRSIFSETTSGSRLPAAASMSSQEPNRAAVSAIRFPIGEPSVSLSHFAVVRRGTATGANRFFVLSHGDVARFGLKEEQLTPVITRLRGVQDELKAVDIPPDHQRFLLVASEADVARDINLSAYVDFGVSEGFDKRHLCSKRSCWFDLRHDLVLPDVIVGAMTRDKFRFVVNHDGLAMTNNLYGLQWRATTGAGTRARLLDWLRSAPGQFSMSSGARQQGRGLLKLEPGAVKAIQIPTKLIVE